VKGIDRQEIRSWGPEGLKGDPEGWEGDQDQRDAVAKGEEQNALGDASKKRME